MRWSEWGASFGQVDGGFVEQWWWYGLGGKGGAGVVLVVKRGVDPGIIRGGGLGCKLGQGKG